MLSIKWEDWPKEQYIPPIRKLIWMDSKFEADGKTPWRLMQCALHRAQTHGAGWNNFSDFWQKKDSVERQIVKGWYKFVGCKVGDRCLSSHRSSSVVASFIIPKGPCVSRTLAMSCLVLSCPIMSCLVLIKRTFVTGICSCVKTQDLHSFVSYNPLLSLIGCIMWQLCLNVVLPDCRKFPRIQNLSKTLPCNSCQK